MKKLKVKVFCTIFSILTIFVLVMLVMSTTRNYMEKKNSISRTLNSFNRNINMEERKKEDIERKPDFIPEKIQPGEDIRRIYMDSTIYTVILDDEGNYKETINNTNNDEFDDEDIKKIAANIINNHEEDFYIGNLYTNKYSYVFTSNNTLIIMDNTNLNATLIDSLILDILIFVLCEIVIFIGTYLLTKWITYPVKKSFEKQKIFIADASHELKTPLAVMIASCDAYFNDKDEKWVHNMKNESERMTKLVTELLGLAKTEKEQDIQMSENNLSDIVESSVLTFESLFFDNNIKLKYKIDHDIKMVCNEDLITELMSILIDNAIKHCGEKRKVFLDLYKNNKQIILEIKNTGSPINKEDEEKIFERFYKVDSSRNRNKNNYGLGLAIAKNIVEKHNGKISAHSSDGYTTFKVVWNQK